VQAVSRFDHPNLTARPGMLRAYGLAVLVHAFLLAALTWGVGWNRDDNSLAVEAELWSALPQEAAPQAAEPLPVETPPPPPPAPPVKVEAPRANEADIARERERERKVKEQAELAQKEKQRVERERQEKAERDKREQQERDKKLAEEKKKKELEAKRKEQLASEMRDKLRKEQMQRMASLAGSGPATSTGTAAQTSGPSSGYAARIRARVKPNIVFLDDVSGNPSAEVEVRTAPDGTIIGRRLTKSSGVASWDEAVLKAIDKTEVLPRDVDGTVWTPMTIIFRPKD
jgi:colicin import membrane protein